LDTPLSPRYIAPSIAARNRKVIISKGRIYVLKSADVRLFPLFPAPIDIIPFGNMDGCIKVSISINISILKINADLFI